MTTTQAQQLKTKVVVLVLLVTVVAIALYLLPDEVFTIVYWQTHLQTLKSHIEMNPTQSALIFFCGYFVITALPFPGIWIVTILGGALFGMVQGVFLVLIAATLGATAAFLLSRYLFQDFLSRRFNEQFLKINREFEKNGSVYLLTLRFIPLIPFFVINLMMGLTRISLGRYVLVSFIGMIPATLVYVYAGLSFSEIRSPKDILTPQVIIAFVLLAMIPTIGKMLVGFFKKKVN